MKKIVVISISVFVVLGLGVFLFIQEIKHPPEDPNNLQAIGQEIQDQGRGHIAEGTVHDPYNSSPPTSGPHYERPASWGVYNQPVTDETVVHNLEHGGIWISYKDIDEATKLALVGVASDHPMSVILTPRPQNDSKIVLASWNRLLKMDTFDKKAIEDFIRHNINKSPEPLAQ